MGLGVPRTGIISVIVCFGGVEKSNAKSVLANALALPILTFVVGMSSRDS